jgi:hypothetical protein
VGHRPALSFPSFTTTTGKRGEEGHAIGTRRDGGDAAYRDICTGRGAPGWFQLANSPHKKAPASPRLSSLLRIGAACEPLSAALRGTGRRDSRRPAESAHLRFPEVEGASAGRLPAFAPSSRSWAGTRDLPGQRRRARPWPGGRGFGSQPPRRRRVVPNLKRHGGTLYHGVRRYDASAARARLHSTQPAPSPST